MKNKLLIAGVLSLLLPAACFANQLAYPACASDHKVEYLLAKANEYYAQKNYRFVYQCLRHSAAQNDPTSQFYIATFYLNGLPGVIAEDTSEAQFWMNIAEFNGSKEAADYNQKQRARVKEILANLKR